MEKEKHYMNQRRLRANEHIRELAAQVYVSHKDFIQPVFVDEALTERQSAKHLTGVYTETIESVLQQTEKDIAAGVTKFLLFPVPARKSENGFSFDFAAEVTKRLKQTFGNSIWLANDVCLCSYTTHGHCGILSKEGDRLLNDDTVMVLADYALQLTHAGSDCIAPSDMSDGRISAIREALDTNGYDVTAIMSYAAKFSSSFYGPFRDVCKSAPGKSQLSNRTTYQLDYRNSKDAMATALRDAKEGADILMVKPALPYLDIVQTINKEITKPIAVYHVSGEYAALEFLAQQQLGERAALHKEVWTAFKRAGASVIISYASREAKEWLL
ncbi:MAG TPA: porphobilinogen synthase [Chitinophagales bacterium]|nr:porphobilinogen synthase [Chitinophagales bacterium]